MEAQLTALLAWLVMVTLPANATAQTLPRVTVLGFTLAADATQPRAGSQFHLIVTLRLREEVQQIDTLSGSLQLPDLASLEILGDERGLSAAPQGSVYREVVTVQAHDPGSITIDPATFDAIDARDGKAKRWSTNSLVLHVVGSPGQALAHAAAVALRAVLIAAALLVTLGIALLLLIRRAGAPASPAPVAAPPREPSARERMVEALALLRADPSRAGAMRARAVLHRMVGASDGETLHDVMLRAEKSHPLLLDVLPQIERAAFTYESDLGSAVAKAIAALESASQ